MVSVDAVTTPGREENIRRAAYDEFRRSRGTYPRAASFLDADRRSEIEQGETERVGPVSRKQQEARQREPARL